MSSIDARNFQYDFATEGLDGLDEKQIREIDERVLQVIGHRVQGIEYAESRRSVLVAISGALFAGSIALLTFAVESVAFSPLRLALVVLGVCEILVAALVWLVYSLQTNFDYPFKSVTKTWKWFYRDALPGLDKFDPPWFAWESEDSKRAARNAYSAQWDEFRRAYVKGLSDSRINLNQDLQQLYTLHANERYKNRFLSQLRDILLRGLTVSAVLFLLTLIVAAACELTRPSRSQATVTEHGIIAGSYWRETGAVRDSGSGMREVQLLINIQVQNQGTEHFVLKAIVPVDDLGNVIPASVELIEPPDPTVSAGSELDVVAVVWIPNSLVDDVNHFLVRT